VPPVGHRGGGGNPVAMARRPRLTPRPAEIARELRAAVRVRTSGDGNLESLWNSASVYRC
jgi:hypothetical protein